MVMILHATWTFHIMVFVHSTSYRLSHNLTHNSTVLIFYRGTRISFIRLGLSILLILWSLCYPSFPMQALFCYMRIFVSFVTICFLTSECYN